jgi:hypothetical protein
MHPAATCRRRLTVRAAVRDRRLFRRTRPSCAQLQPTDRRDRSAADWDPLAAIARWPALTPLVWLVVCFPVAAVTVAAGVRGSSAVGLVCLHRGVISTDEAQSMRAQRRARLPKRIHAGVQMPGQTSATCVNALQSVAACAHWGGAPATTPEPRQPRQSLLAPGGFAAFVRIDARPGHCSRHRCPGSDRGQLSFTLRVLPVDSQ